MIDLCLGNERRVGISDAFIHKNTGRKGGVGWGLCWDGDREGRNVPYGYFLTFL